MARSPPGAVAHHDPLHSRAVLQTSPWSTYTLKSGLTWNDGQPLTSKDLVFTYTRAADSNTTSGWSSYLTNVQGLADMVSGNAKTITGFSAPSPTTFVIKLARPDVGLPDRVSAIGIPPEHALSALPN
jgi:ABC-type transport system substrate-binding protein